MPETALPATDLDLINYLKAISDAWMRRPLQGPYIWPVVRGEAHCNVEFRAKISISVIGEGLAFLNRLSYTHNNEEKFLRLKHWPIAAATVTTRK